MKRLRILFVGPLQLLVCILDVLFCHISPLDPFCFQVTVWYHFFHFDWLSISLVIMFFSFFVQSCYQEVPFIRQGGSAFLMIGWPSRLFSILHVAFYRKPNNSYDDCHLVSQFILRLHFDNPMELTLNRFPWTSFLFFFPSSLLGSHTYLTCVWDYVLSKVPDYSTIASNFFFLLGHLLIFEVCGFQLCEGSFRGKNVSKEEHYISKWWKPLFLSQAQSPQSGAVTILLISDRNVLKRNLVKLSSK